MKEIKTEKSTVRIHEGKLTPEKQKGILKDAVVKIVCTAEGSMGNIGSSQFCMSA